MNIRQKERISFFFIHAITILSLFTYSVCDEKVKSARIFFTSSNPEFFFARIKEEFVDGPSRNILRNNVCSLSYFQIKISENLFRCITNISAIVIYFHSYHV